MRRSSFHYFPLALPFILISLLFLLFVFTLLQIRVLEYAYEKIGINPRYIFSLLFFSLMGSCVNIPVAKLSAKQVLSGQEITFFGIRYIIPPVQKRTRTVIAVNVGGAVIPAFLSLYLLVKNGLYIQSLKENQPTLDALASILEKKEVLSGEDVKAIVKKAKT